MAKASKGFGVGRNAKAKAETPAPIVEAPKTETRIVAPPIVEREQYTPLAFKENEIAEYRGRFPEETKAMSDKQLFDIVMGTEDDMTDEAWKSLFLSSANPNVPDGDTLAAIAEELGEKASVTMGETVERLAEAREDWQGGPVYTLLTLRANYDETVLDGFAIPGSETGINPDRFSISTMKGDKKGTRKTTFYAQFTKGTPKGKYYLEQLEWLDRAADKGAIKDGISEEILEMTPDARDVHRTFCTGRLNTMTQSYKRAMELHFQLKAVNDYADNIVAEPIWQDGFSPDDVDNITDAKIVRSNECLVVYVHEEGKPITKWEHFSVASFLKLKPAKALEQGGGFKKLTESGATKKITPPGAPASKDLTIKTVDTSLGVVTEFHRWLLETMAARDGAEYGKLLNEITKKGNDEYVTTFVELKNALVDICKNNALDRLYIAIKEGKPDLTTEVKVPAKASA
jgi:hypothetical protein